MLLIIANLLGQGGQTQSHRLELNIRGGTHEDGRGAEAGHSHVQDIKFGSLPMEVQGVGSPSRSHPDSN